MSYKIISKFIKDISFEIPNVKTFVMLEKEISKYNLNFDISSKPFKENIIEVNTILRLTPNQELKNKMLTEIILCSIITVPLLFVLFENNIKKQSRPIDNPDDITKIKDIQTTNVFGRKQNDKV